MERRLLSFIIASTAFFFFYISMRVMFAPPPVPAGGDGAGQQVAELDDPNVQDAVGDLDLAADVGSDADGDVADKDDAASESNDEDQPAIRADRPKWLTLGSMNPNSGYRMLVTLNSRGGGLERIELTTRDDEQKLKYHRVDVRSGYLGYFAGEPASQATGVLVNVVGPGTPAALAKSASGSIGIQPGDVILSVGKSPVSNSDDIDDALSKTKPGEDIVVEVLRGQAADSDEIDDNAAGIVTTLEFTARLTEHPLDLVRLAKYGGEDQVAGNLSKLSCLLTLGQVNRKSIATNGTSIRGLADPAKLVWNSRMDEASKEAVFDIQLSAAEMKAIGGESVRLRRTYSLAPESYALDMSVQVENLGKEPQKLAYRLDGVNGVTMEGWWYSNKINPNWSRAAARDVTYKTAADGDQLMTGCNVLKHARKNPKDVDEVIYAEDGDESQRELSYIGVDAQYFNCAYLPPKDETSMSYFRRATATLVANESKIEKYQEHAVNTSFYLDSVVREVPPGAALGHSFRLFAGPKQPEVAEAYGLSDTIYYGWFWPFAMILVKVLHFLYGIVGNYAVAIILLTVCVRGMMFPLSRKAAVNAQRMQELAPELKKIADKYKDDMEGRLKAQRELQQKVGFNPLAGCAPMFLQLPIFIGLYRALSVDIELRQAALSSATSWASNLSGPDMMTRWDSWLMEYFSGRGTGWLGPYFNILPVFVVILFLTQQKLFMPPATDEQTAMTQKVMGFMTLFMGLFFFRVPAGLCLYFIASSLWGICERIMVKKTLPKGKHFDLDAIGAAESGGGVIDVKATRKKSLADKIRDQITPPESPAPPPNKRKRPPSGNKKK
ncbi:membrane protein insertase YidC [Planctomycetes bacterium K23_9]|uniref:Membrane protein insertase YidC n=1 Tax=Stieleria marina TaxID=1930275 RepID=A0A517NTI1_9BACT|nr:Membrane protein insertase YidC [Planctomycetes bacterium K23_9]